MRSIRWSCRPPATGLVLVAAAAVWLCDAGCGSKRRDVPYTEPLNLSDPQVAQGQRVFAVHCHQCHPGGAAGLGPALNNKPLPEDLIKTQVRKSLFGSMPSFPQQRISDEELDALVRYVKALRGLDPIAGG